MKLLLVGAGQLGSRHLQSCMKFPKPLDIYVVDNSIESLELSKERAEEIDNTIGHRVHYRLDMKLVNENHFDFLILATGAAVRFQILSELLDMFSFTYAILEKILFQDMSSYADASRAIAQYDVSVFVNCPLRTYPFFKLLKKNHISKDSITKIAYKGGEWAGLACNSIHYLDLLNFLTDEELMEIHTDHLDDGHIESKRMGCIELTGRLDGVYSSGSIIQIEVVKGSLADSHIEIANGSFRVVIDELSGKFKMFDGEKLLEDSSYSIVYQSDLTHKIMMQLVAENTCDLITFSESKRIHEKYISSLLLHYNKFVDVETSILPIT